LRSRTNNCAVFSICSNHVVSTAAKATFAIIFIQATNSDTIDGAGRNPSFGTDSYSVLCIYFRTLTYSDTFLFLYLAAFTDSYTVLGSFSNIAVVADSC